MADKNIHDEIKNWKKLQNLIEFYKFKINHTFPILYLSLTIISTIMMFFVQSEKIIIFLGPKLWATFTIIFTSLLVFSIYMINKIHKNSAENIRYLYRKLDGQKV